MWLTPVQLPPELAEQQFRIKPEPRQGSQQLGWDVSKLLPVQDSILTVFNSANRLLLILGESGSGKTKLLLDLGDALLELAKQDDAQPIPVLIHLASWKAANQSAIDWLLEELYNRYTLKKSEALDWIENGQLGLLLDGLDEVTPALQQSCVMAINRLLSGEHRICTAAVCCQREVYEQLADHSKLYLDNAVYICPLKHGQIEAYLRQLDLASTWGTVQHSESLLKLLQAPLFLAFLGAVARERMINLEQWNLRETSEAKKAYLLDLYWETTMLGLNDRARSRAENDAAETLRQGLIGLAKFMTKEGLSEFSIDLIQSTLLTLDTYRFSPSRSELLSGLRVSPQTFYCGLVLLTTVAIGSLPFVVVSIVSNHWNLSLACFILASFLFGIESYVSRVLILDSVWRFQIFSNWSWRHSVNFLKKSMNFLSFLVPFLFLILPWLNASDAFLDILKIAMIMVMAASSAAGFRASEIRANLALNSRPTQAIFKSAISAFSLLFLSLSIGVFGSLILKDRSMLILGEGIGYLLFFLGGGVSILQHFTIRLTAALFGFAPWNYARLLAMAVEKRLMLQVGDYYLFSHDEVKKYFAGQLLFAPRQSTATRLTRQQGSQD